MMNAAEGNVSGPDCVFGYQVELNPVRIPRYYIERVMPILRALQVL